MASLGSFDNNTQWPRTDGWVRCVCAIVGKGMSAVKKTPYVELFWQGEDGSFFNDQLYVTGNAISRLAMVAQRVCGLPKDYQLPDSKDLAVIELAKVIMGKVQGCEAMVYVESYSEQYMVKDGPEVGTMKTIKKHRVAPFTGYKKVEAGASPSEQPNPKSAEQLPSTDQNKDQDLPF